MANVSLQHVYKVYQNADGKISPNAKPAVSDFCMEIEDKEFIVFVGPSGCGKSTTLRMIAGLEEITDGEIYIDGKLINDVEPKDRDIAMVFQNYALYPHMTVYDNMAFSLRLRKVDDIKRAKDGTPILDEAGNTIPIKRKYTKAEIDEKVQEAARILAIEEYLGRKPKALSGGQRQRVALGRTIVRQPKVFLLDEPLSNLDAKLRAAMRSEIIKLHDKLGATFIYVTHDQVEAMTMGTRIVVMKDGFVQQ
ncbi:MAG: ATP-binding cassette domain-containing protein, partial [Clostridia bacterium]|nr:ATP-binding cassette domain-containing protein [Clostridia bacterium]